MRRLLHVLGRCALLLLSASAIGACGSGGGEVVAKVGELQITKAMLDHWASMPGVVGSPGARYFERSAPGSASPRRQALLFLISAERTVAEAREEGVDVSDAQAESALRLLSAEKTAGMAIEPDTLPADLDSLVSASGETSPDRTWITKVYLLAERLRQRQLTQAEEDVSPSQLTAYYSQNKASFHLPERRKVAVILTWKKSDIETAKREIESGRNLLQVMHSRDDEPAVGGIKVLALRTLKHPFERAYFAAKPGVLTGPGYLELYYLFEVLAIKPPRQQPLSEVQATIRKKLAAGLDGQAVASLAGALDRHWLARTRCASGLAVALCGGPLS